MKSNREHKKENIDAINKNKFDKEKKSITELIKNGTANINTKYLHIGVIIIGAIFIMLNIFHSNLWFDESYSVALARHSFSEIWNIGGTDVHPILYYFCLHVLNIIFGENLIIYRLFSALMIILLSLLGFTHISKDFGEKVGVLFSFFSLFLPVFSAYSGELRMYSLGMLLGSIMAIYAYRIYKKDIHKFSFIIFGLSSLAVAYTHYYGLMFAGIINLLLLVFLIKHVKERKSDLIKFLITAGVQVVCYLPWLMCFITQLKGVSSGFWITLSFPGTLYEVLTEQFTGNLKYMPVILSTMFYCYIIYCIFKTNKEERKPATWCFAIYMAIIVIALLISVCMHSVILLARYLLILTGLLIFAVAYFMSKDKNLVRVISVCGIILIMACVSNFYTIKENYNSNNDECIKYISENIQESDIIIYSNAINGAVVTTEVSNNEKNVSYFYNKEHWGVQEAYKAYAPNMVIKENLAEILDGYSGRIWIVESGNNQSLLDEIKENYDIDQVEEKQFVQAYKDYTYTVELIKKQ